MGPCQSCLKDEDGDGIPDVVQGDVAANVTNMVGGMVNDMAGGDGGSGEKGAGGMGGFPTGLLQLAGGAGGMAALMAGGGKPSMPKPDQLNRVEYAQKATQAISADVRMFSGCKDEQTSADVYDVSSFGLPANTGPGGAGGACTNAMVLSLTKKPECTWIELLQNMRGVLTEKNFTQIPQLSSSRALSLQSNFSVRHPNSNGRTRALYIGINYVGQQGELRGCHNDVAMMKKYVENSHGFDPSNVMVLMDDGQHKEPTHSNIRAGFKWLVEGAQEGDSLFMHYSGHGGSMRDDNGDEEDGKDETLVPVDYQNAGQIRDDVIFKEVVSMLPKGAQLTVVMDCCHSGSILDLPYNFEAGDSNMQQALTGGMPLMPPNGKFDWNKALKVAMQIYAMYQAGGMMGQLGQLAGKTNV